MKWVNLYVVDASDKKDLYQEILYQSWKSIHSYRGDAAFGTWLYRIAMNTVITSKRKQLKLPAFEDLTAYSTISSADESEMDQKEVLKWAVLRLNEVDKLLITLHLDGYSNIEMAEMIGISINAVGVKLFRVKQKLAELIKKTDHGV